MTRVKRGVTTHARHRKFLEMAKGYYGRRKNCFRIARQAVEKGLQYAYRDRKVRKRDFRGLWIQRLNAAAREQGLTYSQLIYGLKQANIMVNRKMLSEMAIHQPDAFVIIVNKVRAAAV